MTFRLNSAGWRSSSVSKVTRPAVEQLPTSASWGESAPPSAGHQSARPRRRPPSGTGHGGPPAPAASTPARLAPLRRSPPKHSHDGLRYVRYFIHSDGDERLVEGA